MDSEGAVHAPLAARGCYTTAWPEATEQRRER